MLVNWYRGALLHRFPTATTSDTRKKKCRTIRCELKMMIFGKNIFATLDYILGSLESNLIRFLVKAVILAGLLTSSPFTVRNSKQ